jgi:hypothetical protein
MQYRCQTRNPAHPQGNYCFSGFENVQEYSEISDNIPDKPDTSKNFEDEIDSGYDF